MNEIINNFLNLDWERESIKDSIFMEEDIFKDVPEAIVERGNLKKEEKDELQDVFESSKQRIR